MTKVDAINSNAYSPYSVFGSLAAYTAVGAGLGLGARYVLPIDVKKEISDTDRKYIMAVRREAKNEKKFPIQEIRNLEQKTPAQDVFLKWVDGQTATKNAEGKKINLQDPIKLMKKLIKEGNLDVNGQKELGNIISQVNSKSNKLAKQYIDFRAMKLAKRPAAAYITMGAVVGFIGGLINKVITG